MPPARSGVSPQSYIAGARAFTRAVRTLDPDNYRLASPWLAIHGLELALKAYLLHHPGPDSGSVSVDGGDIRQLWQEAHARGLTLQLRPPRWCDLAKSPFRGQGASTRDTEAGSRFPDESELLRDLDSVVDTVEGTLATCPL